MERLPRLEAMNMADKSPLAGPIMREVSPSWDSTLMTDAPWSHSMAAAIGPESTVDRSRMRTEARGSVMRLCFPFVE